MPLFNPGREGFLCNEIVWRPGAATIKADLLRGYSFNINHRFVNQITGAGGQLVASVTLAGLTFTDGVADADDTAWPEVPEGPAISHILIRQTSAVTGGADLATSAQRVICLIDTAPTLPITPNGQDITVSWAPSADRIFRL